MLMADSLKNVPSDVYEYILKVDQAHLTQTSTINPQKLLSKYKTLKVGNLAQW